jgi:hypothetical protein
MRSVVTLTRGSAVPGVHVGPSGVRRWRPGEVVAVDLDAEERDAVGCGVGDEVDVEEGREAECGTQVCLVDGDVRDGTALAPWAEMGGLGVVKDGLEGGGGARPLVEEGGDVVVGALGDLVGGPVVLGVALGVAGRDIGGEAGEVADEVADVPARRGGIGVSGSAVRTTSVMRRRTAS